MSNPSATSTCPDAATARWGVNAAWNSCGAGGAGGLTQAARIAAAGTMRRVHISVHLGRLSTLRRPSARWRRAAWRTKRVAHGRTSAGKLTADYDRYYDIPHPPIQPPNGQNRVSICVVVRCEGGDSNPHGLLHWILSPARLPVPPPSQLHRT